MSIRHSLELPETNFSGAIVFIRLVCEHVCEGLV